MRVVLGVAALVVALLSLGLWLRTSSLVRVRDVTVTGVEGRQAGAIREALTAAALDMTTLQVDEDELRAAVQRYPVVRSLRATTDFPHRLRIAVNAYDPVAALQAARGAPTAVAGDGTLLRGSPTKGLAVVGVKTLSGVASGGRGQVRDARTLSSVRLLAAAPGPLRRRIARVFRGPRGMAATVHGGPKLYFGGNQRLRAKWAAAAQVLANDAARGASYVDVRVPERPVAGGFQPRPVVSPSTLG